MRAVLTVEQIYPAVEELIGELKALDQDKLAAILNHRMHGVAWTSRSELLEELQRVLVKALGSQAERVPESLEKQMRQLLLVVSGDLPASESQGPAQPHLPTPES